MARIKETFNSRAWFMIECDDPNCEQRFDDSQWYADEDDLLTDAKDEGWQILYKDEHPELERDMHYCPAHRLPECTTCTNIMIDPVGWKDGRWATVWNETGGKADSDGNHRNLGFP